MDGKGRASRWKRLAAATLGVSMEEIGGSGTDVDPMQIALIFNAGGNCIGDTALDDRIAVCWEMNARQSAKGRCTTII